MVWRGGWTIKKRKGISTRNKTKGKGGEGEGEMGNVENGNERECEVPGFSERYIGLLQSELPTVDKALAGLKDFPT